MYKLLNTFKINNSLAVLTLNVNFILLILFMLIQLQPCNATCRDISQSYMHYVLFKYDSCAVVFKGYTIGPDMSKTNLIRTIPVLLLTRGIIAHRVL